MISLLAKLYNALEGMKDNIEAAQDAISRLGQDIKLVQRKLGIIPYTMPKDALVCDHFLDAAAYYRTIAAKKELGAGKIEIVRPRRQPGVVIGRPEMYFELPPAKGRGNE